MPGSTAAARSSRTGSARSPTCAPPAQPTSRRSPSASSRCASWRSDRFASGSCRMSIPPRAPGRLILVRHGQSTWNVENLFTGWTDVDLSAQGKTCRGSYDVPPPPLGADDQRHPRYDPRYADVDRQLLPATESLKDTLARVLPFWHARIAPELRSGSDVLVVAHGNSLRAMVKMLDEVSEADIVELNIPTGVPLLYELDAALKPRASRYLGDPAAIAAAADAAQPS